MKWLPSWGDDSDEELHVEYTRHHHRPHHQHHHTHQHHSSLIKHHCPGGVLQKETTANEVNVVPFCGYIQGSLYLDQQAELLLFCWEAKAEVHKLVTSFGPHRHAFWCEGCLLLILFIRSAKRPTFGARPNTRTPENHQHDLAKKPPQLARRRNTTPQKTPRPQTFSHQSEGPRVWRVETRRGPWR